MNSSKLKFSIFLPTLKRPDLLRLNLEALELQTRRPDEVLVSLRGDLDPEGVAVVDHFIARGTKLNIVKVMLTEPGIVVAENALLDAATGDVACLIDDDAIARPFWLENISRHYEADPQIGGVAGPPINIVDGKPEIKRARYQNRVIFPGLILDQSTRHSEKVVPSQHFRGANMTFLISALRNQGGFESRLLGDCFRYELDACLGVSAQGFKLVFDPDAEVDHHEAPRIFNTGRFDSTAIYNNAANETFVLLKHYGFLGRLLHLPFSILVGNFPCPGLLWGVLGSIFSIFRKNRFLLGIGAVFPAIKGRLAGVKMHFSAK
ncbi:MAG TPA: glycosyltransferase family 2 protein [Planctomycetes bacterium]|jgi:GT2 family glycosyltransferase|nr:glycosyltransferase family 2 protein [Planctomycetota bacterium]